MLINIIYILHRMLLDETSKCNDATEKCHNSKQQQQQIHNHIQRNEEREDNSTASSIGSIRELYEGEVAALGSKAVTPH